MLRLRESRSNHKSTPRESFPASAPAPSSADSKNTSRAVSTRGVPTEEDRILEELAEFLESEDGIFTP